MYGQTECIRRLLLEPELIEGQADLIGKAIPGTEAFVLDEGGRPVEPGETGVLYVRGPHGRDGLLALSRELSRKEIAGSLRSGCARDTWVERRAARR